VLNYNAIESCTKIVEDNNYVIGDCGAALWTESVGLTGVYT
jgi:hypothetical protein